jgi:hypothetical protein
MKDITTLQEFISEAQDVQDTWRRDARTWLKAELGDQWDDNDRSKLESADRPVLTFNRLRPLVRLLTGIERKTRYDIRVVPVGEGSDNVISRLLTGFIRKVEDDNAAPYVYSDAYRMGLITGRGWIKVDVNYNNNISGDITLEEVDPYEIFVDPYTRKYDLSDCRYIIRELFLTKDEVSDIYPDFDTEKMELSSPDDPDSISDSRKPYKIYEIWYKEYKNHWYAVRSDTGDVAPLFGQDNINNAKLIAQENPEAIRVVKFLRPEMYYAVISGSIVMEQGPSPYGHEMFPYVPFFCEFMPRFGVGEPPKWHSIITDLMDPQKEKNKRTSLFVDILLRFINKGIRYTEGSIANEEELDDRTKASGYKIQMKEGYFDQFETIEGSGPDSSLMQYGAVLDNEFYAISGISPAMYGVEESSRESGRTVMLRQQQGHSMLAPFQDNMRLTRRMISYQLMHLIPRVFTIERMARIIAEDGSIQGMQLDMEALAKLQGLVIIKNDAGFIKYDIAVSDTPSTPTTRQAEFMELLELMKEGILPMTPNVIKLVVKSSDVGVKNELLQILEQEMQQAQEQQQQQQVLNSVIGGK